MTADERPALRAVRAEGVRAAEAPLAEPATGEARKRPQAWVRLQEWMRSVSGGRNRQSLVLGLALVVACLGYFYQAQRAGALEAQVSGLQQELQDARQDLRAHQEHMQQVRGQVDDLVGRLGRLQETVATDPVAR